MYFLFGHVSKQHDARLLPSHWLILKEKVDKYPELLWLSLTETKLNSLSHMWDSTCPENVVLI